MKRLSDRFKTFSSTASFANLQNLIKRQFAFVMTFPHLKAVFCDGIL